MKLFHYGLDIHSNMYAGKSYLSGLAAPTEKYDLGISQMFPRINKKYIIESGIQSRYQREYLTGNGSHFNGRISDNYVEWVIPGAAGEFIDLDSIATELKIRILQEDGTPLLGTEKITVVDGFHHRIFKTSSVFLNGVQVEANPHFGLINNVKTYLNLNKNTLDSIGANMFYKSLDTAIVEKVDDRYFTAYDSEISASCKRTIHSMGNLCLDLSSADVYMLDNVDMRIRLELESPSVLIMSHDGKNYKYSIDLCKLYCTKLMAVPSAMISLNKSLEQNNYIEMMFDRSIQRMLIFPKAQQSLNCENPFNNIIPHKIIIFMIDQKAFNGTYESNPNFLCHNDITDITLDLNGNNIGSVKAKFPDLTAQSFYQSLNGIGFRNTKHLLNKFNFANGRSIFIFDTRSTDNEDSLSLEAAGNLRLAINCSVPCTANRVVFLLGLTLGVIHINSARRIYPNFLQ